RPPAIFGDQFLERLVEAVGVFQGVGDIGLAEHGLANFQSLVVSLLVHDVSLCVFMASGRRYGVAGLQSRLRVMRISGCGLPPETGASMPPLCLADLSATRRVF